MSSNVPSFNQAAYMQSQLESLQEARAEQGVFHKSLIYGGVAAVAGSLIYAIAGVWIHIGLVGLLVAFMVGKAMMTASDGKGGAQYQIAAVTLTYFAISTAALLEAIFARAIYHAEPLSLSMSKVLLVVLGSPVLRVLGNPRSGIINLAILFVSLRGAYRFTKGD